MSQAPSFRYSLSFFSFYRLAIAALYHTELGHGGLVTWRLKATVVPTKHSFEFSDPSPITYPALRLPPRHNDIVREEIDKILKAGIITPSVSPWSFAIVIVVKRTARVGSM